MVRTRVKVGEVEHEYGLFETTAPKAYDHGGTLEFRESVDMEGGRLILIPTNAIEWSKGRYGSGLYPLVEAADWLGRHVEDWLWKRIFGEEV